MTDKNGRTNGIGGQTISDMDLDKINMVYYCRDFIEGDMRVVNRGTYLYITLC